MRHKLVSEASSSCQLFSALAGLNPNFSVLSLQMQASHTEMMGALGKIVSVLEIRNASVASGRHF